MTKFASRLPRPSRRQRIGIAAAGLLALGAAGGAGAVSLTRPGVEMAPTVSTPVARLSSSSGLVTVRGRVAEVYGDRFVVQDRTGRALVDAGRDGVDDVKTGAAVLVQGRFDDGQLRARYLVDAAGGVREVGRRGPLHGAGAPPPPHGGPGAPPPPAPGGRGAPPAPGAGAPPPPPPGEGKTPAAPMPPATDTTARPAPQAGITPVPAPTPTGRR